eukprot:6491404-Amphidinium_carterae.1
MTSTGRRSLETAYVEKTKQAFIDVIHANDNLLKSTSGKLDDQKFRNEFAPYLVPIITERNNGCRIIVADATMEQVRGAAGAHGALEVFKAGVTQRISSAK